MVVYKCFGFRECRNKGRKHQLSPSFILEKIKFIPLFRKPIFIIHLRKIFFELRIISELREVLP